MKHCVIKVVIVAALGFFALPRLYAQDTTITIYGKKFAPGVIVKINGKQIFNVQRDSAQPSRILYVTFPLSELNKPTSLLAEGKDAGLNSSGVGVNEITVANPGQIGGEARYIVVTKLPPPRITLLPSNSTDTINALQVRVPATSMGDTSLRVVMGAASQAIQSLRFTVKNARFQIYDSTGSTVLTSLQLQGSRMRSFRLRFNAQDTVIQQDTLLIEGLNSSSAVLVRQRIPLLGIPLNIIRVLAAYTAQSSKPFYVTKLDPFVGDIRDGIPDSISNPRNFLTQSLAILNAKIELTFDATPLNQQTVFTRTRFTFIDEPIQISYQERAEESLFNDIDALTENTVGLNSIQITNADIALLVTNTSTTPYKAIANTCEKNTLPKFIVVEAKYAKGLINPFEDFNLLFTDIRALIEKRQ